MTNLADTYPYVGPVSSPSYPAIVSSTTPANPTLGMIWFNPPSSIQVYTSTGWQSAGGAGTLAGLLDVDTSAMIDGDTLIYDARTTKWMAVTVSHDYGRY